MDCCSNGTNCESDNPKDAYYAEQCKRAKAALGPTAQVWTREHASTLSLIRPHKPLFIE